MDTHKKIRVHISALGDGELPAADLELAFAALQSADGKLAWSTYHRIGDVLRAQATPELSDGFLGKLNARLAAEAAPAKRAARAQGPERKGPPALPGRRTAPLAGAAPAAAGETAPSTDAKAVEQPKPAINSVS